MFFEFLATERGISPPRLSYRWPRELVPRLPVDELAGPKHPKLATIATAHCPGLP